MRAMLREADKSGGFEVSLTARITYRLLECSGELLLPLAIAKGV